MYSLKTLTFFILTFIISQCHVRGQTRIIGGKPAAQGMFPYQAYFRTIVARNVCDYRNGRYRHVTSSCGGSLISESFVITAAHCLKHRKPLHYDKSGKLKESLNETVIAEDIDLLLGAVVLRGRPRENHQTVQIFRNFNRSNFLIHPRFYFSPKENGAVSEMYDDIALIRLPTPAKFNGFVRPIQLPTPDLNDLMQGNANVVGFGMHNTPQAPSTLSVDEVLRYANVDIISNVECKSNHTTEICIRGKRNNTSVGTCGGDSGGPLIFKSNGIDTIVGIVSYGLNCTDGSPHYFTRVTEYLDWIHENMNRKYDI